MQEEDEKGQLVCFSVSDTGIGLTNEQMGRLVRTPEKDGPSDQRADGPSFSGVRTSGRFDHAAAWRHGPWARDIQKVGAINGWRRRRDQRSRKRQYLLVYRVSWQE